MAAEPGKLRWKSFSGVDDVVLVFNLSSCSNLFEKEL